MAQKRMIDKKISISEQVSNLDLVGQLLFTWMIPHADDLGLLPYSVKTIKAMVIPMLDIKLEAIGFQLESIENQGLIIPFEYKGEKFWRIKNFSKSQTLKKDRNPQTLLKITLPKEAHQSWKLCQNIVYGNQMEYNGNQMDTEVKLSEVKLSEVNKDSETFPSGNARCPLGNGEAHKNCIQLIDLIAQEKKTKFPNYPKQINALHKSLRAGFKLDDVEDMAAQLIQNSFYKDAGWDLMTVANELGKRGQLDVKN